VNVNPVTILLVDDDKVDVMAVRRAFRQLQITNPIIEAGNGMEALERLRGENGYQKVPQPALVLLDLNMPCMNGIEFLEELRSDPLLGRTIVFVMTTSSTKEDRARTQDKNVAGYILKTTPESTFLEAIKMLQHSWQTIKFPI